MVECSSNQHKRHVFVFLTCAFSKHNIVSSFVNKLSMYTNVLCQSAIGLCDLCLFLSCILCVCVCVSVNNQETANRASSKSEKKKKKLKAI
jgi:hypothetical protein